MARQITLVRTGNPSPGKNILKLIDYQKTGSIIEAAQMPNEPGTIKNTHLIECNFAFTTTKFNPDARRPSPDARGEGTKYSGIQSFIHAVW